MLDSVKTDGRSQMIWKMYARLALPALATLTLSACTASTQSSSTFATPSATLKVCSGYSCTIVERFQPTETEIAEIEVIMSFGVGSPEAERDALKKAIGYFERTARKHLKYRPDVEKAYQKNIGKRGQMDCVDESLNTTGYLQFMESRNLLTHHRVRKRYAERGLLVDGRYPHKSAVVLDGSGTAWAVDSWYHKDGVEPQIMKLSAWRRVRDSFNL